MSVISASKLNKSYGITPALTDVSFNVNASDRIGIVGANGAGKSTLIKILAGELEYDSGELFIDGKSSLGYLKQRDHFPAGGTVLEEMQKAVSEEKKQAFEEKNGYSYASGIRGILKSLAFSEEYLDKPVDLLSGGERTRLALAALLLQEPDILLLDEPTNHLDIGTLKWLEDYLKGYKGTMLIISHDRYFLDRTVKRIFEVENTRLTVYEGNYTQYKEKKQTIFDEQMRHYEHQMEEIRRQEEIIRRFKGHNTEKLVKRAQSREKRLAMTELPEKPVQLKEQLKLNFQEKLQSGNDVLYAKGLSMSFTGEDGTRQLFRNVDLDIKRGDRICIVGPNGIGKTTLLKIILGQLQADSGELRLGQNVIPGYYDQEQRLLNPNNTVLEEIHSEYIKYDQTRLRGILGSFLFRGDDVFKTVADLAGGEKARLSLLKLMMSGANLLIMDEPTNHLDISAKEIFEDALLSFPGTLLLVSHDRYLLQKIPTAILELDTDGITVYLGGYDYYTEKRASLFSGKSYLNEMSRRSESSGTVLREAEKAMSKEERTALRNAEKQLQAAARKQEKMLARAEEAVSAAEARIAELEQLLCDPDIYSDPEKARRTAEELDIAKEELEKRYEEWMELQ